MPGLVFIVKILTVTTLYPNAQQPNHGIFVENRLRHLVKGGKVSAQVIAPVPWFPLRSKTFGRYVRYAQVPNQEVRHGLTVYHPRYTVIPKIGMSVSPLFLYRAFKRTALALRARGDDFDLIDAHYFYPDGVAAVLLARALNKPVVITGRGTDLNLIPRYVVPRKWIRWAANRADGLITVCEALKEPLDSLGIPNEKVQSLPNGVDLEMFKPIDRDRVRQELGLQGPVVLSVGHLIPRKGHDLAIRALALLDEATLLIVGDGPEMANLNQLVSRTGLTGRVRFLGAVDHEQLANIYSAADVLALTSDREGWPNVLLESMACGTPVAATDVWGNREVVRTSDAGRLVPVRTPEAIAEAVNEVLKAPPSRAATRRYAEQHDWRKTTEGQIALYKKVVQR